MKPTHDLMIKVGKYTTGQGESKNRWLKIGTRFQRDDGSEADFLEAMPVGNAASEWNGWVSAFPIKPRANSGYNDAAPKPASAASASAWDEGDDIPF